MENILQFFSIWQKLKVTVSTLFTAPRDFKFSETLFFTHCHIRANFATLWSEKVAYHFTLIYFYTVHWHHCYTQNHREVARYFWDKLWNKSFFERIKGPFIIIHDVNCNHKHLSGRKDKIWKYTFSTQKWWLFLNLKTRKNV